MGVRITDSTTVALYDSVSGIAFGAVFQSTEEAEEFIDAIKERAGEDPRAMTPSALGAARLAWEMTRDEGAGDGS